MKRILYLSLICYLCLFSGRSQIANTVQGKKKFLVSAGEFKKIYNPSVGESSQWYINDHCFVFDKEGVWHMFGITHTEPAMPLDEKHFAHATASSLKQPQWEKLPFALSIDDSKQETILWAPNIILFNDVYYMFYVAGGADHSKYKINLATSTDLKTWIRHQKNPIVVDGFDARDPFILRDKDVWILYYTANTRPTGGNHIVAYRTSKDLINWSDKKIAFTDPMVGTFGGPTESPYVVRRGSFYYLFIGPRDDYVGTNVYRSKDPFRWNPTDKVGFIKSHAAEIVRDADGRWYVSHAGWGQGGLYLAPLIWNDGLDDSDTSVPIPNTALPK